MRAIFQKRRQHFNRQCLGYLRYVFNDHFVLALFFLLGFVMMQYNHLLTTLQFNKLIVVLLLLILMVVLLRLGRIATYLESADKQFLLPKESEVVDWLRQATRRSWGVWTSIQTFVLLVLAPLFLKIGIPFFAIVGLLIVLAIGKWFLWQRRFRRFFENDRLKWEVALAKESQRQQSILLFFSLFTTVKGLTTSVKRRAYLDGLLSLVDKGQPQAWYYLYWRAFLRGGDYAALTLRLVFLSLLSLLFISERLLAVGVVLVFDYLLIFQLLALYQHFDYQYVTHLYPLHETAKSKALKRFLRIILYSIGLFELVFILSWQGGLLLVGVILLLAECYLPYKIKKMID